MRRCQAAADTRARPCFKGSKALLLTIDEVLNRNQSDSWGAMRCDLTVRLGFDLLGYSRVCVQARGYDEDTATTALGPGLEIG